MVFGHQRVSCWVLERFSEGWVLICEDFSFDILPSLRNMGRPERLSKG